MKTRLRGVKRVFITGDFIRLDALLKYAAVASTGGEAKALIQDGNVYINGEACNMRGKKVKPGEVVRCAGDVLLVRQRISNT